LNQNFLGKIGAGKLEIGNSVVFVDEMSKSTGNAVIKDHEFYRFNFELYNIQNTLTISNVQFTEACTVDFKAKKSIDVTPGSLFKPGTSSFVNLSIDNTIPECNNTSSRTTINNKGKDEVLDTLKDLGDEYNIAPTVISDFTEIYKKNLSNTEVFNIEIYNLQGQKIYSKSKINTNRVNLDLSKLSSGIYIARGFNEQNENVLVKKIIKI